MMNELAKRDYWRAVMYSRLKEDLANFYIKGTGVEFGGSNGIIQSMLPDVTWEVRRYPEYDITKDSSFDKIWDIIIADQVLEHTEKPWEAIRLIGEHTQQLAIITVPFLIRIHNSPKDYWRMTPRAIYLLAKPYFKEINIKTWGTAKVSYWHSMYNRTDNLLRNVSEKELEEELNSNDSNKPFVIWAIMKK